MSNLLFFKIVDRELSTIGKDEFSKLYFSQVFENLNVILIHFDKENLRLGNSILDNLQMLYSTCLFEEGENETVQFSHRRTDNFLSLQIQILNESFFEIKLIN